MPTRDNVIALWPILEAFAAGKTIQHNIGDNKKLEWIDCEEIAFTDRHESYRIKPEPVTRTRPFTLDEFRKKVHMLHWVRITVAKRFVSIEAVDIENTQNRPVRIGGSWYTLDEACNLYVIINPDGTESPFGVEVVE